MSVLLLRLAGPLQAWGDASRFARRHTRPEPTKSGIVGLLAAADGRRRTDPIEDLAHLTFGVRVDQPGRLVRDFQTARSLDGARTMPLSYRYYLADAVFVAGVEGDPELIAGLDDALRAPVFPLYLGRRSCPPARELRMGVRDGNLASVLRDTEWQAARWYRRRQSRLVDLRLVLDLPAVPEAERQAGVNEIVRDLPSSFDPIRREYGWRDVVHASPVQMDNPDGHLRHDPLAALGGA